MEDGSDSRIWPFFSKLFSSKGEIPFEEVILEAKEDGELTADEVPMLLNVLRMSEKRVQEIMVPRTDIVCIEITEGIMGITKLIIESGHSRIPIYKDNRDSIVGIVHAKDLLQILIDKESEQPQLEDFMRKPYFVPETKNIKELSQEFRARKTHLAIVLDEYGGTAGLVTFEDVLEEIVGEIEDEHDAPRPDDITVLENNNILVSGRTPLDELDEETELALDSEQVETIGGYLCELAGRVPNKGESFSLSGHRLTIKEADAKQIRWIIIQPPQAQE